MVDVEFVLFWSFTMRDQRHLAAEPVNEHIIVIINYWAAPFVHELNLEDLFNYYMDLNIGVDR